MNAEEANGVVESVLREYVKTRSSTRKDKDGSEWSTGMTLVSPDDKRIEEISRLVVEGLLRMKDLRPRITVEIQKLQPGDIFTRYSSRNGIAIDEEVTVVKVARPVLHTWNQLGIVVLTYRRADDTLDDVEIKGTYLVSVVRPTKDELRKQLEAL